MSYAAPKTLELFILPGSSDLVVALQAGSIEPQLEALRIWARQQGLTPVGPALLGWDEWANRELRQPVRPVFGLLNAARYRLEQRSAQLVVELPLHVRNSQCNLAGVYDLVSQYRLEPLGAPLVPMLQRRLIEHGMAASYIPVTPRGTRALYPQHGWFERKMGLHWPLPRLNEPLGARDAWRQTSLVGLQIGIAVILTLLVVMPYIGIGVWLLAGRTILRQLTPTPWLIGGGIGAGVILLLALSRFRLRMRAVAVWNQFWSTLSSPRVKYFIEEVESVSPIHDL